MPSKRQILLIGRASKSLGGIATGGISKHIEDLSKGLIKNNIEPFIWDFKIQKSINRDGINIFALTHLNKIRGILYAVFGLNILISKYYRHLSLKDKFIVAIQSYSIKRFIELRKFKTVHVHSLNRPITSFLRRKFPYINIVVTDHGFWQNKAISKDENNSVLQKLRKNIESADKIITISKYSIEQFKEYRLPLDKTILIPNPISIEDIPFVKQKKENIIFFNGFSESLSRKNLTKLIEALKSDSYFNKYKLIAIVNTDARQYLDLQTLNFDIEILGAQPWNTIVEIYNKSKILVVPSKSESFGLVYLEALAVGTPIIGFYKTVSEFMEVMKLDIGEPFNDAIETAEDLATKIKMTLTKTYNSNILRSTLVEHYDWNAKIKEFIYLYKF